MDSDIEDEYEDPFLGGKVLGNLFDVTSWNRGYSSVTLQDIFEAPVPGSNYNPVRGIANRANLRSYRLERKYDLANHYRYNQKMLTVRAAVISRCISVLPNFYQGFGKYGNKASFQAETEDGRIITVNLESVQRFMMCIENTLYSYNYILEAWSMRNPFTGVSQGPISFSGMYRPYQANEYIVEWLAKDPKLSKLRKHYNKDGPYDWSESYFFAGEVTPYSLEFVVRLCLVKYEYKEKEKRKAKEDGVRLPVLYYWSDTMTDIFKPTAKTIKMTQIKKFVYLMLEKKTVLHGLTPPFDPKSEVHGQFLDEMLFLQDYADSLNQEKVDADKIAKQGNKRRRNVQSGRKAKHLP